MKKILLSEQLKEIRAKYPGFEISHGMPGNYVLKGQVIPRIRSDPYNIDIYFNSKKSPKIFVKELMDKEYIPHRYPDKSLCLFKPSVYEWRNEILLADTIIPWVALWLYYYEIWLELGVWLGPEAQHLHDEKKNY